MLKRLALLMLFITCLTQKAQAIVFIEPIIGYGTGSMSSKYEDLLDPSLSYDEEFDLKGLGYGLRGGLEMGNWQLGAEYTQHKLKVSGGSSDVELDDDEFNTTEMAALIGYRFNFFRIYGGYIFSADLEDSELDPGKGFKAGLSFYALKHMALNLEYRTVELDEVINEIQYSQTALILSFPFSF